MSNSKSIARPEAAPRSVSVKAALVATPEASAMRTAVVSPDAAELYGFGPQARIAMIRRGIPASVVGNLSARMGDHDVFTTATCYAGAIGREQPKADTGSNATM